jgi:hypothetical protein
MAVNAIANNRSGKVLSIKRPLVTEVCFIKVEAESRQTFPLQQTSVEIEATGAQDFSVGLKKPVKSPVTGDTLSLHTCFLEAAGWAASYSKSKKGTGQGALLSLPNTGACAHAHTVEGCVHTRLELLLRAVYTAEGMID